MEEIPISNLEFSDLSLAHLKLNWIIIFKNNMNVYKWKKYLEISITFYIFNFRSEKYLAKIYISAKYNISTSNSVKIQIIFDIINNQMMHSGRNLLQMKKILFLLALLRAFYKL